MFIVELREDCCWIASGDFRITNFKKWAKKFKTELAAQEAIDAIKEGNEYREFTYKIIPSKRRAKLSLLNH